MKTTYKTMENFKIRPSVFILMKKNVLIVLVSVSLNISLFKDSNTDYI